MLESSQFLIRIPIMKKIIKLSQSSFIKWYVLLCILYILFLVIDHNFIFSEAIYMKSLGANNLNANKLQTLVASFRNSFLSSMALTPIAILAQVLLVSFCLFIGFVLRDIKTPLIKLMEVVTKSLIIFPIMDILSATILISTQKINTIQDTQKPTWFSLMFFFNEYQIPKWLIYPLKTVSITEFLFVFLLMYNLYLMCDNSMNGNKIVYRTAALSYFLGLVFWVTFIVFLKW